MTSFKIRNIIVHNHRKEKDYKVKMSTLSAKDLHGMKRALSPLTTTLRGFNGSFICEKNTFKKLPLRKIGELSISTVETHLQATH